MAAPRVEFMEGPDDREGVLLTTPYHLHFIEQLKALVPYQDREWWPDSRGWWVSAEWADVAEDLVLRIFGEVQTTDEDGQTLIRTGDGQRMRQEGLF